MKKPFKFKIKTIQLPWTPECRAFFGALDTEIDPAFYSVTIKVKSVLFTARFRDGMWTTTRHREIQNILNVSIFMGFVR